jgi:hypothetical protein
MVTGTRLSVAFIVHCLSFMILLQYALNIVSYITSHGRKVNNEVQVMTVVAYFKALCHSFPEQTVQKHGNPQKISRLRLEPDLADCTSVTCLSLDQASSL